MITNISPYKKELSKKNMHVPAILHVSDALMPEDATIHQLEKICCDNRLFHHVVAMNDVHSKPGRVNPTGTVIASENHILPQVNDSDPNCGMRFVRTDLHENNFSEKSIDILFRKLTSVVPTKKLLASNIPFNLVLDICRAGVEPAIEYFNVKTKNETENSMSHGNFFGNPISRQDILDIIPNLYLFIAKYRLGILGAAGNHFLDMMKITDIEDASIAKKFNLSEGQYIFLIHTGSGILGQYTMYTYTDKKREHLSQAIMTEIGRLTFPKKYRKDFLPVLKAISKYRKSNISKLFAYEGDSLAGQLYMMARNAASNYGNANRMLIAHNVAEAIRSTFNRDPKLDLLYDMPHIYVGKEKHYGKDVWIHRNGTSRAFGPSRMSNHPLFSQTGEPAFIPSSMSTPAYLGVGTDGNETGFFSSGHGTGKSKFKTEDETPESREALFEKMKKKGVRLYNAKSSHVIDQDASHYKSADEAIRANKMNGVLKPVIKMQPVAVIMY